MARGKSSLLGCGLSRRGNHAAIRDRGLVAHSHRSARLGIGACHPLHPGDPWLARIRSRRFCLRFGSRTPAVAGGISRTRNRRTPVLRHALYPEPHPDAVLAGRAIAAFPFFHPARSAEGGIPDAEISHRQADFRWALWVPNRESSLHFRHPSAVHPGSGAAPVARISRRTFVPSEPVGLARLC